MDFLPQPQSLAYHEGAFLLTHQTVITLQNTLPSALLYAQMLRDEIEKETGLHLAILRGEPRASDIVLTQDASLPENTYHLLVKEGGVALRGGSDEAVCHGVQTLRQLVKGHGFYWPCLSIQDYPDIPNRGYSLDVSRGRVPTLETLKQYADLLCRHKINHWQLYMEHTYLFRDFSEAWRDETPLTAEEIMELDAYCLARHIELVPSLATFGHMYKILSTKTNCDLCELSDSEKEPFSYVRSCAGHTLNVSSDRALGFVKGMIDEYMHLFSSRKFNLCADETFDLGKGRNAALCKELGEQTVYVAHVKALCEHLVASGRTPMFWGDIIFKHPETYALLPKETICLNWGYMPNQREDEIRVLAEVGATQYACPGVCAWNQWIPLFKNAYDNIRVMCAHAHKYKAIGLLNTDWGDYGHINHPWFAIPGILYGAAFSWNAAPIAFDEMNAAISYLAYGDNSRQFMSAFVALSGREIFSWHDAVHYAEARDERRKQAIFEHFDAQKAHEANEAIHKALHALRKASRAMPAESRTHVMAPELVASGVIIFNNIGSHIAHTVYGKPAQAFDGDKLATELETWFAAYLALWRTVSKEGSLSKTLKIITAYADMLRGR